MAPNGIALSARNVIITLPASAPAGAAVAWEHLRGCRTPAPLPPRLYELSAPQPAMLTYLCTRYVEEGAPSDVVRFVQDHERIKIFYEVGRLGGQRGCCDLAQQCLMIGDSPLRAGLPAARPPCAASHLPCMGGFASLHRRCTDRSPPTSLAR